MRHKYDWQHHLKGLLKIHYRRAVLRRRGLMSGLGVG